MKTLRRQPLLAALRAVSCPLEKPAPGFRTAVQWAEKWGLSEPHALRLLRDGIKAGLIISRPFRIKSGPRIYPVPHYAEKK